MTSRYLISGRRKFCSHDCRLDYHYAKLKASVIASRPARSCKECGAAIGPERDGNTRFCTVECGRKHHLRLSSESRSRVAAGRRAARQETCRRCGKPIPESRLFGAKLCSEECYRHAVDERWKPRRPGISRLKKYGITPEQYDAMLDRQDHRCAVCRTDTPNGKGWHVDHDHASGKVRGILCGNCNNGIGNFHDDPATLRAAIDYLTLT
jgi:predicted nucleic acid-binding Zn ribbon protein